MATMEAINPHQRGHQQPYPPLPASPTLTNPDMILPDYDRSDSPDDGLNGRDHSPLMMWKNAHITTSGSDLQHAFTTGPGQQHADHPYGPTGPITPTTPIIYGNGTMLSDIGEVTEAESTPGRPSPARTRTVIRVQQASPTRGGSGEVGVRSSPTIGKAVDELIHKRSKQSLNRERRSSMESTSTITTQDQANLFADFDDSVSVGDSVFQGDDEESVAESYVEEAPKPKSQDTVEKPDRASTYSTASLSRRAEQILANAKKRLTTMEGNLTRARSTLYVSSSTAESDGSTPSPPLPRAATAMYTRANDESSPNHSRTSSSDIAMRNGLPYRVTTQRSASALGVSGGYRQPLSTSRSVDQIRENEEDDTARAAYKSSPSAHEFPLEPLSEDGGLAPEPDQGKLNQFLSPTFGTFSDGSTAGSDRVLTRSASVAQMKDLRSQMKDLKGKISTLRDQARADTMKRRSLQSLRTPSPFTHAQVDPWYSESRPATALESGSAGAAGRNPWNGEESSVDEDAQAKEPRNSFSEEDSVYSEVENPMTSLRPSTSHSPERRPIVNQVLPEEEPIPADGGDADDDDDISDMQTENGDIYEDVRDGMDDAYESESGESAYHDTLQHPISHEDREDAFDYEHFFLHSAMGNMTRRKQRRGSYSSEESVETTRGPITEKTVEPSADSNANGEDSGSSSGSRSKSKTRARRDSTGSVSSIESFATAEERSSRLSRHNPDDEVAESPMEHIETIPEEERPETPQTARRSIFGPGTGNSKLESGRNSMLDFDEKENHNPNRVSVTRRPMSSAAHFQMHRPSTSSFDSTGTTRSFPLVNRPKKANSTGILTPQNSSPDPDLKTLSDSLLSDTATMVEQNGGGQPLMAGQPQAMNSLLREDQFLVERLVASLGRCVLGLTESGRASSESRMFRRRIDLARRILEGDSVAVEKL